MTWSTLKENLYFENTSNIPAIELNFCWKIRKQNKLKAKEEKEDK